MKSEVRDLDMVSWKAGEEKTSGGRSNQPWHTCQQVEMRTAGGPLDLTTGKTLVFMNNFGGTQWGKPLTRVGLRGNERIIGRRE